MKANEDQSVSALRRLTDYVSTGASLDEVLNFVFDNFQSLLPYQRIGYAEIDPSGGRVVARWARSDRAFRLATGFSAPLAGSSLELLLKSQKTRVLNNLPQYLERHPRSLSTQRIVEEGFRSSLTCPLVVEGKAVGFLFFTSAVPNSYSCENATLFQQIASQLALQILLTQERERSRKTLSATVVLLMSILEMVSPNVSGQATRVRRIVQTLTHALDMKNAWEVELASLLCRLGCLTIPDDLIERQIQQDHLTDVEQELLRSRVDVSYELLAKLPYFHGVAEIVRRQGDAFDPSSAESEPIQFSASVLRAALDFDGLRSQGMPPFGALAEMRRNESQYAPGIVAALESTIKDSEKTSVRRDVALNELTVGMRLGQHVHTEAGTRLLSAGYFVTEVFLHRLRRIAEAEHIREPIAVEIPFAKGIRHQFEGRFIDTGQMLDLVS